MMRISDPSVAEKIREQIHKGQDGGSSELDIRMEFPQPGREGFLNVAGEQHQATVLDLPTFVECYKTLDDVHCIKLTNVSQMIYVGEDPPKQEGDEEESRDGITPPFRDVRQRMFKPPQKFPTAEVTAVEEDLLAMFDGWAPPKHKFIDTEEQCVRKDGKAKWEPLEDEETQEK